MLSLFRNIMGRRPAVRAPSLPGGERVYAVGDIHGRADLFEQLIDLIETDDANRGRAFTTVIVLGDLIDRGPDSARVVKQCRQWATQRNVKFLQGNHEEMFLVSREDTDVLRSLLKFGGVETLQSYGIAPHVCEEVPLEELQRLMLEAVPPEDFEFLDNFEKIIRIGDYAFVHAGVRPNTPLDLQMSRDCRWIREPFLSHRGDFGAFIIHGHTITQEPDICPNRIGVDTGAYLHGTLTAIGLQGTERWFLQASEPAKASTTQPQPELAAL